MIGGQNISQKRKHIPILQHARKLPSLILGRAVTHWNIYLRRLPPIVYTSASAKARFMLEIY